ncbi:glutathione S-transferase U17-like [Rutidosis leptorrhynchoides]|uniref:glutathione S-transferase U17-like n=1 Tax=Rutidosis leptorrhynchoides TaxID=125765 RepID=UPI003A9A5A27
MAKKSEIKLLGTVASPYVNRVQFVLHLKSIDYEFIDENLANKSELLLASNPVHKKVPVLLHADKPPIPESLIIIEYLDEIYPDVHKLLPTEPLDRAENRFWANYIDTKFFPLYEELRLTPGKEGKEAVKKQIMEGSKLLEETFVKISKGKAYFGGDDLGYLDVVLGCFLAWTEFVENINDFKIFDDIKTPRLAGWRKRMCSHQTVKGVTPGNDTLVNFYMMLQKYRPPRAACLN